MAKKKKSHTIRSFLIELLIYSALVAAYVLFVIGLFGNWLHGLYQRHITWYAVAALALIVAQGVMLEFVTSFLLRMTRSRSK